MAEGHFGAANVVKSEWKGVRKSRNAEKLCKTQLCLFLDYSDQPVRAANALFLFKSCICNTSKVRVTRGGNCRWRKGSPRKRYLVPLSTAISTIRSGLDYEGFQSAVKQGFGNLGFEKHVVAHEFGLQNTAKAVDQREVTTV